MGVWIVVATVLFLLGSFMALKPSGVDVRLDKLRMVARRLELNPKVVACPIWLSVRNNELGRGMIGQYALVLNDKKFAESYYRVEEKTFQAVPSFETTITNDFNNDSSNNCAPEKVTHAINTNLSNQLLDLPKTIAPYIRGIYCKANYLVVFWDEVGYVQPISNPNYDDENIESDLLTLKSTMHNWAEML